MMIRVTQLKREEEETGVLVVVCLSFCPFLLFSSLFPSLLHACIIDPDDVYHDSIFRKPERGTRERGRIGRMIHFLHTGEHVHYDENVRVLPLLTTTTIRTCGEGLNDDGGFHSHKCMKYECSPVVRLCGRKNLLFCVFFWVP